jgi:transcriptional regulator with XRE-family HTH domain
MPAADAEAADPPIAEVGRRIMVGRRAQRLTIEALADASGLTKSFLSKVERGRATASVAALLRISQALGIPLSSLFENSATRHVVRASDYPRVNFGGHQLAEFLLTPVSERRAQVLLSRIEPGGGSGEELYPLPGEVEFAYVISGALELTFTDEVVELGPGDAITFDPALHRSFQVPPGGTTTTALWLIAPALPQQVFRL